MQLMDEQPFFPPRWLRVTSRGRCCGKPLYTRAEPGGRMGKSWRGGGMISAAMQSGPKKKPTRSRIYRYRTRYFGDALICLEISKPFSELACFFLTARSLAFGNAGNVWSRFGEFGVINQNNEVVSGCGCLKRVHDEFTNIPRRRLRSLGIRNERRISRFLYT